MATRDVPTSSTSSTSPAQHRVRPGAQHPAQHPARGCPRARTARHGTRSAALLGLALLAAASAAPGCSATSAAAPQPTDASESPGTAQAPADAAGAGADAAAAPGVRSAHGLELAAARRATRAFTLRTRLREVQAELGEPDERAPVDFEGHAGHPPAEGECWTYRWTPPDAPPVELRIVFTGTEPTATISHFYWQRGATLENSAN